MNVTIVCGLLGAGKTSYITNLLRDSTEKAVVLVNDFGSLGIDGKLISSSGIEAVELPSGCVCCTLKPDLLDSIRKVTEEFSPDHLVIEPSGVASPSGVLEALEAVEHGRLMVVGVIDASQYLELYDNDVYGSFFVEQISLSDLVVVNKTDLADERTRSDTVELVKKINPSAVVIEAVGARVEAVLPEMSAMRRPMSNPSEHRFEFRTFSFRPRGKLSFGFMESLFSEMAEGGYGGIVRAKALLNTDRGAFRFDLSYGNSDALPFEPGVRENLFVVIGNEVRHEDLSSMLLGPLAIRQDE